MPRGRRQDVSPGADKYLAGRRQISRRAQTNVSLSADKCLAERIAKLHTGPVRKTLPSRFSEKEV